jgi:hypothetical protein
MIYGIRLDPDQLHGAQGEPGAVRVPAAILAFRFWPAAGYRDHESLAPAADIVSDVRDDLVALADRGRRVPGDEA